tara:strand:- start:994 stop:1476 length:483 start_codon:yes stop_codon:yes gene_type:complete
MHSLKNKFILNIVLIFSIFSLVTAYFIQYFLGHKPCNLCLLERIPYFAAIILISLIFIFNKYEKSLSFIVSFFFICGAIISFYHFGIEQGFFSESLVCDLGSSNKASSAQDLLKQLEKEKISCKDVTFKLLGFSLATFNTIISIIIGAIMFKIGMNYENK